MDDKVTEASRSNIFVIKDGVLQTPKSGILAGVTRMHVMKIAEDIMPVKEDDFSLSTLLSADEVFVTSSVKEVLPIVKVDDNTIGGGKPGELTLKLRGLFTEYIHSS